MRSTAPLSATIAESFGLASSCAPSSAPAGPEALRLQRKEQLRHYHLTHTSLEHEHWGVRAKTWKEWMSARNRKPVPSWVVEYIDGEEAYDGRMLAPPRT